MSSAIAPVVEQQTYPYFTEEHAMLRETVKQFCLKEIAPHSEEWDEEGIFPREIFKKAGDLGLFGIRIDPKWAEAALIGGRPPPISKACHTPTTVASGWR